MEFCPECGSQLIRTEGCMLCPCCGWSACNCAACNGLGKGDEDVQSEDRAETGEKTVSA